MEIIAEIAQGYEGSFNISKKLISAAKKSTAHAIKFQMVYADELATKDYKYYKLFKKLEMSDNQWKTLIKQTKKEKIKFYLDIFGEKSLKKAINLKADGIKIHPTDLNNFEFLKKISLSKVRNVFLGVGGANLDEIYKSLKILKNKHVILLFGFQSYPTPLNTNQISRFLNIKSYLKKKFGFYSNFKLGFADHSLPGTKTEYIPSILSIGAGASFLEKHLTINFSRKLEDSESAYQPDGFKKYVEIISNAQKAMGKTNSSLHFGMSVQEKKYKSAVRRSCISKVLIKKNTKFKLNQIEFKRTNNNNGYKDIRSLIGKISKIDIKPNKVILKKYLK